MGANHYIHDLLLLLLYSPLRIHSIKDQREDAYRLSLTFSTETMTYTKSSAVKNPGALAGDESQVKAFADKKLKDEKDMNRCVLQKTFGSCSLPCHVEWALGLLLQNIISVEQNYILNHETT